jgi:DNA gyrase inhibitor GyrI
MAKRDLLHVGICKLEPVQVVYKTCLFRSTSLLGSYDRRIRETFQIVRERIACFGLDPEKLLHIGIPTLENKQLVTYDCCVEFLFPLMENNCDIALRTLPGGDYDVLRVEKTPAKIRKAIDTFLAEYIPDNGLIFDENRPTYEIYYEDTMEYCVPIQK